MGNMPSLFCPSESSSQCIGKDSLLVLHPCSVGVMLTPSEKRLVTDVSHQRCCPRGIKASKPFVKFFKMLDSFNDVLWGKRFQDSH
jgi:hypothetical protein